MIRTRKIKDLPIAIIDGDRSSRYPKRSEFREKGVLFLNTTNIVQNRLDLTEANFISQEKFNQIKKGRLQRFDIVISTRGSIGKVALFDYDPPQGLINAQILILRADDEIINRRFLFYQTCSDNFQTQLKNFSSGSAQPQIPIIDLQKVEIVVPPLPVQHQIADFLDRKTGQIDELLRIKERRIELLQEQRTALINQAVTKGLDPNVEMKPSQLEWIGQIPEHWEVIKFHYLSQESRRKNDDDIDREMLSLSSYTGVQVKQYEYENTKRSKEESLTYLVVEPNQLVVNPMWQIQRGIGVSYLYGIVSPGYRVYYIDLERLIP